MRMKIDHPVEGKMPNIGFAVKRSGTPQLGGHTEEVLAEIGVDAAERARLREEGAFGS